MAYSSDSFHIPQDILDDLSSRFIINAPIEEQQVPVRLCFLIEQAHWFYLDFYCSDNPELKACGMKEFSAHILSHIPYLKYLLNDLTSVLDDWRSYKSSVPTYGAIVLNEDLTKVLLVQSYFSKASWGFPKGKVNEEEDPRHCAVREVLEETGFDITSLIDDDEYIETTVNEQTVRLYLIAGVNENTKFQPKTRNEIKNVEWFHISDLPSTKKDITPKVKMGVGPKSFFMVLPFIKKIKRWVQDKQQKNQASQRRQRHKSVGDLNLNSTTGHSGLKNKRQIQYLENIQAELKEFQALSLSGSKQYSSVAVDHSYFNSRKQLFSEESHPIKSSKTYPCTSCKLTFKEGPYFCISSWTNFKLDKESILRCFDD